MQYVLIIVWVLSLSGCDFAARQQAREEALREQKVKELKAIGESLHQTPAAKGPDEPQAAAESASNPPQSFEISEEKQ